MNREGKVEFKRTGSLASSLLRWAEYSPRKFSLSPGGMKEVSFRVSLSKSEENSNWGVFLVRELADSQPGEEAFEIRSTLQYGVTVYQKAQGALPKGGITGLSISPADEEVKFEVAFENRSQDFLRPKGSVEVRDRSGTIIHQVDIAPFLVLPGYQRETTVTCLEEIEPGRYLALATLDHGGSRLVASQREFWIKDR